MTISFEEFYLLSKANQHTALCELFGVTHIPKWQIKKLEEKLLRKELTLAKLYLIFTTDDFYNTLSKIVRADWEKYPHPSFVQISQFERSS